MYQRFPKVQPQSPQSSDEQVLPQDEQVLPQLEQSAKQPCTIDHTGPAIAGAAVGTVVAPALVPALAIIVALLPEGEPSVADPLAWLWPVKRCQILEAKGAGVAPGSAGPAGIGFGPD
jgi:hypothetical protein